MIMTLEKQGGNYTGGTGVCQVWDIEPQNDQKSHNDSTRGVLYGCCCCDVESSSPLGPQLEHIAQVISEQDL